MYKFPLVLRCQVNVQCTRVNGVVRGTCRSMCFCCELSFGLYPMQVILAREASVRPSSMLDLNKEDYPSLSRPPPGREL